MSVHVGCDVTIEPLERGSESRSETVTNAFLLTRLHIMYC